MEPIVGVSGQTIGYWFAGEQRGKFRALVSDASKIQWQVCGECGARGIAQQERGRTSCQDQDAERGYDMKGDRQSFAAKHNLGKAQDRDVIVQGSAMAKIIVMGSRGRCFPTELKGQSNRDLRRENCHALLVRIFELGNERRPNPSEM